MKPKLSTLLFGLTALLSTASLFADDGPGLQEDNQQVHSDAGIIPVSEVDFEEMDEMESTESVQAEEGEAAAQQDPVAFLAGHRDVTSLDLDKKKRLLKR